ncbi:MAG: mevalonate kinase [Candidatus Micrarchaeota archaeon]
MARGIGRGKTILFGEHFVVHGAPAIAGGISNSAIVDVVEAKENKIITELKVVEELSVAGISAVLKSMGMKKKYQVRLSGDLPTYGGLGSSAAFCVALVKAFAKEKKVRLKNDIVNQHAYDGEMAFHGNPSGVDNTVATYGGIVEYRRGKTMAESQFDFIRMRAPLDIVITFSGKYSETTKMIERVQKFKDNDKREFSQLMDEYIDLEINAKKAIEEGDLEEVGRLMNTNQRLLSEIGVSNEKNDEINEIAMVDGALGTKVTGGGGGGCCIALARDENHAIALATNLKKHNFDSFPTRIIK